MRAGDRPRRRPSRSSGTCSPRTSLDRRPAVTGSRSSGVAFGAGEHALAGEIFELAEAIAAQRRPAADRIERNRAWLEPWVRAEIGRTSPRRDRPVFAVMDYGHPGMSRGSANIGDHVQSIASLGHLVRHQSVRFHGDADLVALLDRLPQRTRPELRRDSVDADST